MRCNCRIKQKNKEVVTIAGKEVMQMDQFLYLESIIHNNREIGNDVNTIKASWLK